jgi:hypothetical protein
MAAPTRLEFSLAKAEYLLTRVADPGQGGDKRNFWHSIMGFESAEALRTAILEKVSLESLEPLESNDFGERYRASIQVVGPQGMTKSVLTIWIVLKETDVARFVTAYPDRKRRRR